MREGKQPRAAWWVLLASGVVLGVGCLGPWARVFGLVSVTGLDVDGGFLILLCAIAAVVFAFVHLSNAKAWPIALTLAAASVALALITLWTIGVFVIEEDDEGLLGVTASEFIQPGWGLYLVYLGAISTIVTSIVLLATQTRVATSVGYVGPAPGWYSDPWRIAPLRFWSGAQWTAHTAMQPPAPRTGPEAIRAAQPPPTAWRSG